MVALDSSKYFRDLDWEKLKAFYYVAKFGNISHAASLLNLAQSSSSRHISGLEKHLGYPLFSRKKDGVTLTRKGEELFEIAEGIFLNMKGFTSRTYAPLKVGQKRKVRIATSQVLASYLINDLILDYNTDHPDLVFEVIGVDQAIDIILHDVDIAIQPHDSKSNDVKWGIIQEPFFVLKKKLYASALYIEKYGEPQTVADLKHHSLIVSSAPEDNAMNDSHWISRLGREKDKQHDPVFLSNSLECLVVAAQKGKGIISAYGKTTIIQNSNLKNILPDFTTTEHQEYFVYPEYLKDDQDIMGIKDYLKRNI